MTIWFIGVLAILLHEAIYLYYLTNKQPTKWAFSRIPLTVYGTEKETMIRRRLSLLGILTILLLAGSSFSWITENYNSSAMPAKTLRTAAPAKVKGHDMALVTNRPWPAGFGAVARQKADEIDELVDRYHRYGFHGNVLVAMENRVIYQRSVGNADFKTGQALTMETPFQLASVSKQFTAAAIMLLAQDSLLHYDDDIRKYLPELSYEGMTIRRLLNHTAGLPNYMWILETQLAKDATPPGNQEVVKLMGEHDLPLYFTPGKYFDYSNTGYVLLAAIVERVSGQNFADFTQQRLFEPLGMNNTFVWTANDSARSVISGYYKTRWNRYGKIVPTIHDGCVGDKGVYSTVGDLFKWQQAFFGGKVVEQPHIDQALAHGRLRTRTPIDYGFGFRLDYDKDGKKIIYHNGLWEGFRTCFWYHAEDESLIVVLNHTNSDAKHTLVRNIKNELYRDTTPQDGNKAYAGHYDADKRKWMN